MRHNRMWSSVAVCLVALSGTAALAQGGAMGMGRGMMGAGRDSATVSQMGVFHELVINNTQITRSVSNLPNGIRTVTRSQDPRLAALIREHVTSMDDRIAKGDDPGLPMESPALRALFVGRDKILTSIVDTADGVVVTQTSTDPAIVTALQQHAAEVTDLVQRGRAAMHDAMMKNGRVPMRMDSAAARPPAQP